jgi:hypothetical protein
MRLESAGERLSCLVGVLLGLAALERPAWADDPAYCRKVEERAAADASLLFAPQVQLQAIKFPRNGAIDVGVTTSTDVYQLRAGLSVSAIDFYKAFGVLSVGDADCQQHRAAADVTDVVNQGTDFGRLDALRKQAAFLEGKKAAWDWILAKTDERLDAHVIVLIEANEVRTRAAELEHKLAQVHGDIARIEAARSPRPRGRLADLVASVEKTTMTYEERASHVRKLAAWDARISGGIVPQDKPIDYYAVVQLGFNFGSFWQNAHEARALDARRDEIKKARYELREQVRRFEAEIGATRAQAQTDLAIVDKRCRTLHAARSALEESNAPGAPHACALVDLELLSLEADKTYLEALVDALARFQENERR